jgi:hypothetical protein
MNYFAESIRDCSKNRPSNFTELSFSISQEVEKKIKSRKIAIRRKIRQKMGESFVKSEEGIKEEASIRRCDFANPSPLPSANYLQVFDHLIHPRVRHQTQEVNRAMNPENDKLSFQIYSLMSKHKPIFKVEEFSARRSRLRKVKTDEESARREGRHHYKGVKTEIYEGMESEPAIELAEEYMSYQLETEGREIAVMQLRNKDEEMSIPKIDKMQAEEEEEKGDNSDEEEPLEMDRIAENESKSEVSESRRRHSQPLHDYNSFELEDALLDKRE